MLSMLIVNLFTLTYNIISLIVNYNLLLSLLAEKSLNITVVSSEKSKKKRLV